MTKEIQRAMEKERKNFGIPEEDEPPYEDETQTLNIITTPIECTCDPVKSVMTEEIQRAMEKERKNFGIPEEDEPPYEDETQTLSIITTPIECTCDPVKSVMTLGESPCEEIITPTSGKSDKKDVLVIVISDDEDEKEKQERAREEYGITFEQYYNLI